MTRCTGSPNQLHSLLGGWYALLEVATTVQVGGDPNYDQADLNLRGRALKGRNLRGRIRGHWSDVIRAVFGLCQVDLWDLGSVRGPSVEPTTDAYIKWGAAHSCG